ncbi:signal transduction histidine kinase [Nonlabens ulvanivorans]|uniref:Signal transduction histidine kinase n=1 Tax=Nonlabens ulvanivorans TaxID=906888 RepID=A0A090QCT1_NONUL|nr:putative phage abortive infection protein [Nonlabens ulvanivorans]GAL00781.1 signal transduction histidine kinase [Nonlabens ulvanivorans]
MNISEKFKSRRDKIEENKHLIYLLVIGVVLITFGILAPMIFNQTMPSWFNQGYDFETNHKIGRSFGNYIAPFIALLGVILTFAAFYIQFKANQQVQKQFKFQKTSSHFYKMLDIHISNIEGLSMKTFRQKCKKNNFFIQNFDNEEFSVIINLLISGKAFFHLMFQNDLSIRLKNILNQKVSSSIYEYESEKVKGKRVFILMEKDLHLCFKFISDINSEHLEKRLSEEQINKLAYKIFFWGGTDSNHIGGGNESIEDRHFIVKSLNHIRKQFRENKGAKYSFKYPTNEGKRSVNIRFIPFSGHASRLAHYYRHLYQTVRFLHLSYQNDLITALELESNLKTLRAQFTNEEVLLLYYNYLIGFGHNWDQLGKKHNYRFFKDYGMIHNIPLHDNIYQFVEHPVKHFEDFIIKMRSKDKSFEMFEWGEKLTFLKLLSQKDLKVLKTT